jgi:hypothetical protein
MIIGFAFLLHYVRNEGNLIPFNFISLAINGTLGHRTLTYKSIKNLIDC